MRRGTWILAISGMMALQQSGYAADPAADQPSGRFDLGSAQSAGTAATGRSGKKSADGRPKNYYKDLFGDDEGAPANKKIVPASAPPAIAGNDWADDGQGDWATTPAKSPIKKVGLKVEDYPAAETSTGSRKKCRRCQRKGQGRSEGRSGCLRQATGEEDACSASAQ